MATEALDEKDRSRWSVVHGLLLLGLAALPFFLPLLSGWPIRVLFPPLVYALVVISVPSLRRSAYWFRFGRVNLRLLLLNISVIITSISALLLWHAWIHPDLRFFSQR